MANERTVNLSCSFCGKHQREVKKLIAGPQVCICDECIGLCNEIIAEEVGREAWAATLPIHAQVSIGGLLDRGSKAAERLIASAEEERSPIPGEVRSALAQLASAWASLRASVERVGDDDSVPPRSLEPVLGLLTRVGDVVRRLAERANELGLAQWHTALEESLQDLATVDALLRAGAGEKAAKDSGPAE